MTLANRRAPGVCFVLGFTMYFFWHQGDLVYLFLAKTLSCDSWYIHSDDGTRQIAKMAGWLWGCVRQFSPQLSLSFIEMFVFRFGNDTYRYRYRL